MRGMRGAKPQQGHPGAEMPKKIIIEKEKDNMNIHYDDYTTRGQSSAISKEDAGCRNDGHRLTSEGATTPPHEKQEDDNEAPPRSLLDTVNDHRSLLETLISLGADQCEALKNVSEVYSPPRVTKTAARRPDLNAKGLRAFDLSTSHPGGGNWDFNIKAHRELARQICDTDDPDWMIGSPHCTDFSILGRSTHEWTPRASD